MNLDELFDQAARVAEPELPADVLGGVRRLQARRRRRQLIAVPVACVVIAAGLLVPTLLVRQDADPVGPAETPPPTTASPTTPPATPAPTVMVGIDGAKAVRVDLATGKRTDLGSARSITLHGGEPWMSRPRASCDDTIVTPDGSFPARGGVPALEVSPDGKTLAFVRQAGPASKDYPDMLCSSRSIVLRDLTTGVERSWSADDSSLWGLTWSADSHRLAFTLNGCCGDYSPDVHVLNTSAAPGDAYDVLALPVATDECTNDTPVFSDETLLLVVRCHVESSPTTYEPDVYELRDASSGALVMALQEDTSQVSADPSGQHFLVFRFTPGVPQPDRHLYAIRLRDHSTRELSPALSDPHW